MVKSGYKLVFMITDGYELFFMITSGYKLVFMVMVIVPGGPTCSEVDYLKYTYKDTLFEQYELLI